ncbi:hypothetical protein BJ085DRAFT_28480 [Dimargaris cristalligena]|uniref:RRM domain-containing protein n=1 Tax=Dimargaris cristalligena TaxID=215637 RepID=A0A4P9ZP16_9FUNG|nr:hypothetical protein BJ085DRAFT_28480 [Dimargaris cristalligena]|eukprot:RKP34371.1 hypothetical protein BJ085DRAFT_28480 [Dimargaris cristalligena]
MTRVYIGNLGFDARTRDVEKLLRPYGRFYDLTMRRGYAFVSFESRRDAEDALYDLDRTRFLGDRITVEYAKSDGRRERSMRPIKEGCDLIIENLSSRASWKDLKDLMRPIGPVTFADCHKEYSGEGIVQFKFPEDAERAIRKLDGIEFMGRRIGVRETTAPIPPDPALAVSPMTVASLDPRPAAAPPVARPPLSLVPLT